MKDLRPQTSKQRHTLKRFYLLPLIFYLLSTLSAINIHYKNTPERDRLTSTKIEGYDYYSLSDLRQVFKTGNHHIDYEHNKLNFSIFDESVIMYLNTHFVEAGGRLSNLSGPIVQRNSDFYFPETLYSRVLPEFFPQKFSYDTQRKVLLTDKPSDKRVKTIVIDPGHGGKDPGALGKNTQEKNLVLEIAKKLKTKLERELDVNVLLTRTTDDYVSLQDRTNFANSNNADLFISLHLNSVKNKTATGIEVFFLSTARTNDERAIEALENSVVFEYEGGSEAVKVYDDLAFILADLQQSEQLEESSDLAIRLQTELITQTNALDRGVKQADFYVLRGAFMPSVLIEFGFISNEEEERKMTQANYQNQLVNAVANGIKSFKAKYDNLW